MSATTTPAHTFPFPDKCWYCPAEPTAWVTSEDVLRAYCAECAEVVA